MILAAYSSVRGTARLEVARVIAAVGRVPEGLRETSRGVVAAWADESEGTRLDDVECVAWSGRIAPDRTSISSSAWEKLSGDFAFASLRADGLVLGRGRYGGGPLYFATSEGVTIACSRLEPLARHLARAPLRRGYLATFLLSNSLSALEGTPYVGIERVDLGTIVLCDEKGTTKVLRPAVSVLPTRRERADHLAAEMREHFMRAVSRAVGDAKSVGILAGGGVDSSNLLATALAVTRGANQVEARAISVDIACPGDDRPYLDSLCAAFGIRPIRVPFEDGLRFFDEERVLDAAPHLWGLWSGLSAVRQAREHGIDLILTGESSELLLEGNPETIGDLFSHAPLRALRLAWRLQGSGIEPRARRLGELLARPALRRLVPQSVRSLKNRFSIDRDVRYPPWAGVALRQVGESAAGTARATNAYAHKAEQLSARPLLSNISDFYGRVGAAGGCRFAFPYLDDEFVAFSLSVPPLAHFWGEMGRGLLRESMRGLVPDKVRLRRDKARPDFAYPHILRQLAKQDSVRDLAEMRALSNFGLVDASKYARRFRELADNEELAVRYWWHLVPALSAEAFARRHERRPLEHVLQHEQG